MIQKNRPLVSLVIDNEKRKVIIFRGWSGGVGLGRVVFGRGDGGRWWEEDEGGVTGEDGRKAEERGEGGRKMG